MDEIKKLIRTIPDFPKKGIEFRDLTTLFLDPDGFRKSITAMAAQYQGQDFDVVVGVESRGFIVAAPLALELGKGFVPIRKPGKLPRETLKAEYALEYGTDELQIHSDAISPTDRVLIVDDLLATGGTLAACCKLVEQLSTNIVGISLLIELTFLKGRDRLGQYPMHALLRYDSE